MSIRTLVQRAGLAVAAAAVLATPAMTTAAEATRVPAVLAGGQAGAVCLTPEKAGDGHEQAARGGRGPDHSLVPDSIARQVNEQVRVMQRTLRAEALGRTTIGAPAPTAASRIPQWIVIDVYVHNVYGKHRGERDIGKPRVRLAIETMKKHFAGLEMSDGVRTRFVFRLMSIRNYYNDAFYHARPYSPADRAFKRKHHRGGSGALNIYIAEARDGSGGELLGWARFPWEYARAPRQDGVTVHPESLPGRQLRHYNEGDTLTHEVGHWLGLFHVFEGGCANSDGVGDTPAQQMLDGCPPPTTNSCLLQAGFDTPENYMQYTFDRCMQTFSRGQSARMDAAWMKWRA